MYIADVKISIVPRSPKSRLHPVYRTLHQYPVVMTSGMKVHHDMMMGMIKRSLKGRISDWDRYVVKYECSNVKFSTKCNWTINE